LTNGSRLCQVRSKSAPQFGLRAADERVRPIIASATVAAIGTGLVACFVEAGLTSPHLFCECVIGDSTSLMPRWWVLAYRGMLPQNCATRSRAHPRPLRRDSPLLRRNSLGARICP
jgi:hypothetical protein